MAEAFFSYDQLQRSWYMFFFQSPLADMAVPMDDLAFIDRLWADWSPGYDAADDLAHVKDALRDPANLTAALGYYRATLGAGARTRRLDAIEAAGGRAPRPADPVPPRRRPTAAWASSSSTTPSLASLPADGLTGRASSTAPATSSSSSSPDGRQPPHPRLPGRLTDPPGLATGLERRSARCRDKR